MHSPLQLEPMRLSPCGMPDKITVYAFASRCKDRRREKILHHADLFANSASNPRCRICSQKAEKAGHLARLFRLYLLNTLLMRTFSSHLRHACFHAHLRVTHRPAHCKDRRSFLVPDRTIIHIAQLGLAPRRLLCAARGRPQVCQGPHTALHR